MLIEQVNDEINQQVVKQLVIIKQVINNFESELYISEIFHLIPESKNSVWELRKTVNR